MSKSDSILISEIFGPTIQGEGALIGEPTLFIRTGGCDYRCSWCDTLYAVESKYKSDWSKHSTEDILDQCLSLAKPPIWITLSGGNPAIQPLEKLIKHGQKLGFKFAMETQGSIFQPWFNQLDHLILSPKPPSSDMKLDIAQFLLNTEQLSSELDISFKTVIANDNDYTWTKSLYSQLRQSNKRDCKQYIQPCNPNHNQCLTDEIFIKDLLKATDLLITKTLSDEWFDVIILPQLHAMLWPGVKGV